MSESKEKSEVVEAAVPTPTKIPMFREVYPLYEPHAYAAITKDPRTNQMRYIVIEPTLLKEEVETLNHIKKLLTEELEVDVRALGGGEAAEKYLKEKINEVCKRYKIKLKEETLAKLVYYLCRDFIYFGKIDPLMRDHLIEDISCDAPNIPIYIWHRELESVPTNISFDKEELDSFVVKLAHKAGKHISIAQPMLDAGLPDGSRVQLTLGAEVTRKGSTFTIRKFRADPLTVSDLIQFNTLSSEMAAYFWYVIENRHSVIIAGGVASGKTTTLNCLSMFIRPELKVVSVEDTPELNLPQENWIQSVVRAGFGGGAAAGEGGVGEVTLFDLLKVSVRQRPDYIIVGEIRGAEAYTLFQAMATGHLAMSTIHADSVPSVIHRLESEPMNIPRILLKTLDVIAVILRTKLRDMPARRIVMVSEVVGLDPRTSELLTSDTYTWDSRSDSFSYTGRSVLLEKIARDRGLTIDEVWSEINRRKVVLEWAVKRGIRRYLDVANIIRDYYVDPEKIYRKAKLGLV